MVERRNRLARDAVYHDPQPLVLHRPEFRGRRIHELLGHLERADLVLPHSPTPFFSAQPKHERVARRGDRKSTRLNSSHSQISYAVFCLKKKKHITKHNISSDELSLEATTAHV